MTANILFDRAAHAAWWAAQKVKHPLTVRYLAGPFETNRVDRRRAQRMLRTIGPPSRWASVIVDRDTSGRHTETRTRRARLRRRRRHA